jgi:hypothetical protein
MTQNVTKSIGQVELGFNPTLQLIVVLIHRYLAMLHVIHNTKLGYCG